MVNTMEKKLLHFNELGANYMLEIDSLTIYNEETTEEQKKRNREKRKWLIDSIDAILNANEKTLFKLKEYRFAVEHPNDY
jgi:hypothetical protein